MSLTEICWKVENEKTYNIISMLMKKKSVDRKEKDIIEIKKHFLPFKAGWLIV